MDEEKDRDQGVLHKCGIKEGRVYRDYKGEIYIVVVLSIKEDTLEPVVTYRSNKTGECLTRTLDSWNENVVVNPGDPISHHYRVPRFERYNE